MFDVVLYICGHGDTKDPTCKSVCDLLIKRGDIRADVRWITGDALIGRSRSRAASKFLWCDDSPYMIFIDTDIVFTPEDIERLYRGMQAGYEVIAGGYAVGDGTYLPIQCEGPVAIDGKIHEAKYVSTGFMGISRKALQKVKNDLKLPLLHKDNWAECWPFFESGALAEESIYLSEDWDFCRKCRKVGVKVYFHTGVLVGHDKDRIIPASEAVANMNEPHRPIQSMQTDCLVYSTLIDDLQVYAGASRDALAEKIAYGSKEEHAAYDGTGLRKFYQEDRDTHLWDLAQFNLDPIYWKERVAPLSQERDRVILDFGCGIGSLSLYLASLRNKVVGYDINPTALRFAKFRAGKFGFSNLALTDSLPSDLGQFDLVCAVDVLEHVEDLRETILRLGAGMKPGAKLYHWDSFYREHPIPIHLDCSPEQFDGYLKEAGFAKFDKRWAVKI